MRSYYHCSTAKFRRRRSVILTLVGSVSAEAAVISFIVMFLSSLGTGGTAVGALTRTMLLTAGLFVTLGLGVCFITASSADKKAERHSRYTFLDVQLKAAVISVYSGEMKILGQNTVFRELYLVPFRDLEAAVPSANGKKFMIRGKIRRYGMESDFLGYHVRGGDIEFDRMWLNVGSFVELNAAEIPAYFGNPAKLCAALAEAKKRFDEIPDPRRHRESAPKPVPKRAPSRPIKRSMPDNPDFSRTWK